MEFWLKMGDKRLKIAKGLGNFVPVSVNFSQLEKELDDSEIDYHPSDGGLEIERIENNMQYEELVVQIFCNLEPREKLIFAFQLLRDGGYQIDHASFAKVVNLSRSQYMRILDVVRVKSSLFVIGYANNLEKKDTNKPKNA